MIKHIPVLLKETLVTLQPKKGEVFVDATFGAGGHASEILKKVGPAHSGGRLIGLDRDPEAIDQATHYFKKEINEGRLILVLAKFSEIANVITELGLTKVSGILMDFGVSSNQLLSPKRGFSFLHSAPLDMRMNQKEDLTAARLLAEWSSQELSDIFFGAGEKQYATKLARRITRHREKTPIKTTDDLIKIIEGVIPASQRARRRNNVATKIFLALRMATNHELQEIERGLEAAIHQLKPGGRLVAISFQSLEDRIIKRTFRRWASNCVCPPEIPVCRCNHRQLVTILTKKGIKPTSKEISSNPRARSATLRSCEKL